MLKVFEFKETDLEARLEKTEADEAAIKNKRVF